MDDHVKHWIDAGALGTVAGTLLGWLPQIAAGLSIVWTLIRIYETKTVQHNLSRMQQWLTRRP